MKIMVPPCNRWSCSSSSVPSLPKGIAGRKRGRPCSTNAARERSRVRTLRLAFLELQNTLPAVPPDTKLSKLDVLVLATTYISHLLRTLNDNRHPEAMTQRDEGSGTWLTETGSGERERSSPRFKPDGLFRPVKKWPMRSRLYASIFSSTDATTNSNTNNRFSQDSTNIAPAVPQITW